MKKAGKYAMRLIRILLMVLTAMLIWHGETEGIYAKNGMSFMKKSESESMLSAERCAVGKGCPVRKKVDNRDIRGEGEKRSAARLYQGGEIPACLETDKYEEIIYIGFCKEWRNCRNGKKPITTVRIIGR